MFRYIFLTIFVFFCCCFEANAAHLVGGDLSFQCLGNNNYSFQLKVYRDAGATAAPDDPAFIFIYNQDNGQIFTSISANTVGNGMQPVANNDLGPCITNPIEPNLDFATYNFAGVNLPQNTNGYRVIYQRCCRTNDAVNITLNFDGISQGSTYEALITPKVMAECNGSTSPIPSLEFNAFPPSQLCANLDVIADQSVNPAVLGFVDSVVYSICAPYEGGSGSNCIIPQPGVQGNCNTPDGMCSQPCNYSTIRYQAGYTATAPMGSLSTVNINPQTGSLLINPSGIGIYVVGICARAYKDGVLWSDVRRDFQFKVFDCENDGATPPIANNGAELDLNTVNIDSVNIESVYLVCNNLAVNFDQTSTQALNYFWDFGVPGIDSDTSIQAVPTYTYPDTGTYVVTFIVNRNEPCVDTAYGVVKVFPNFIADFTFESGCFTIPVQFMDSTTTTLNNNLITDWNWDFGDGIFATSTEQNPIYQYSSAGTYQVTLEVMSELGCKDEITKNLIAEPSPSADFDNLMTCTGSNHIFTNLSSLNGTTLMEYSWDFGDGNGFNFSTTTPEPPAQTYTTPGGYTIQLAISSTGGCSDTMTKTLTVIESVQATFDYMPTPICPGQEIQFTNTTAQAFDSVIWVIDGNVFNINDPVYAYPTPGNKDVSLVIFSRQICKDSIAQTLLIEDGPFADFEVDSTCVNSNYSFVNNSNDNGFPIDSYIWTFGDGGSSTDFEPTYEYNVDGDYPVTLIVSSNFVVCSDTTIDTMHVKAGIVTDFSFAPDTICEGADSVFFTNLTSGGTWDSVFWDLGNGETSNVNNPSTLYNDGGFYDVSLTVFDDICGELDTSYTVEALDIPNVLLPDTLNICDGQFETLTAGENLGYDIMWSTGESSQEITIDNSIDTIVVVINNRGCVSTDTTIITRDCPAYLPNTFTPNGDGINDLFGPLEYNITSFTLKIYDRWGKMVYETSSFDKGWDGNYDNGDNAPLDSYSYIFDGIGLDEKVLFQHGTISLLR